MKQASIIINVVLAVGLAILYYLHFNGSRSSHPAASAEGAAGTLGDLRIAYINADSVLAHYEFYKINREKLEAKGKKMDTDLNNRAQGLQREITSYQNTVANLTIGQARALEEDLTKKQQNLRVYQERLSQELAIEENKFNKELYDRITAYLKDYGKQNNIHAVLKYDLTSDLLYAGDAIDITKDVIAGLNEGYKNEKSPASDSTKVK
ncbi:MAG: OmpH family outer membrane protein [Cyclobacteriaceae bacterium]|nr:OmpH family outer membrane protein [Cyclobacteriaceae bacterium]MCB0500658.1 OmpH family outer membrane protein [Cyclobacteriaceae bacterium]MCB9236294.1 OmpH family outer membrane protein [Flammeovirgaceae bacterium]MCO5272771.1 OmpH family outer membrane protein [Cyclobacteriaceae bacterium]MCW5903901.1 OmpH family outer membrane protein [Cyclobacteriaceae bacterium]